MQRALSPLVLVSLVLSASACWLPVGACLSKGGTRARDLHGEELREVDFVYFQRKGGSYGGGTSRAKIILKPNPSRDIRVAVYEEFSGGAGEQWRASAWMASFLASQTLGRTLADYEFAVSAGGLIDGPSAGALTTAAMMAAMTGAEVRPEVTMTGTVNPDGSVGPVGGIPQKIRGAAQAGKKVFGYPVGQRYDLDLESERVVDLHGVAGEAGIEVHEVRDIWGAYELLTGKTLPRPVPVEPTEMDVSSKMFQRMQAKTTAWLTRAETAADEVKRAKGLAGKITQPFLGEVSTLREKAVRYQTQGMVAAAFDTAMQAFVMARVAQEMMKIADAVLKRDKEAFLALFDRLLAKKADVDAFVTQLETSELKTAGQTLVALSAYQHVVLAYAGLSITSDATSRMLRALNGKALTPQRFSELANIVTMAIIYGLLAEVSLEVGRDLHETPDHEGEALALDAGKLALLSKGYTSAAKANLDYYDALVLKQQAEAAGATLAAAQQVKAISDPTYMLARAQLDWAIATRETSGVHNALARLSAALASYTASAGLVSKEYSLGARMNDKGELELSRDKALIAMLELAEKRAREAAAEAKQKVGAIPDLSRYGYQLARAKREGKTEDKLDALSSFWSSTALSQLAVLLAAE